jgi:hypothetical protein
MFGIPREGAHYYRILSSGTAFSSASRARLEKINIAVVDLGLTILAAYLVSLYFEVAFWKCLIILFIIGIICHRIFCVRTTVDKLLFSE